MICLAARSGRFDDSECRNSCGMTRTTRAHHESCGAAWVDPRDQLPAASQRSSAQLGKEALRRRARQTRRPAPTLVVGGRGWPRRRCSPDDGTYLSAMAPPDLRPSRRRFADAVKRSRRQPARAMLSPSCRWQHASRKQMTSSKASPPHQSQPGEPAVTPMPSCLPMRPTVTSSANVLLRIRRPPWPPVFRRFSSTLAPPAGDGRLHRPRQLGIEHGGGSQFGYGAAVGGDALTLGCHPAAAQRRPPGHCHRRMSCRGNA